MIQNAIHPTPPGTLKTNHHGGITGIVQKLFQVKKEKERIVKKKKEVYNIIYNIIYITKKKKKYIFDILTKEKSNLVLVFIAYKKEDNIRIIQFS